MLREASRKARGFAILLRLDYHSKAGWPKGCVGSVARLGSRIGFVCVKSKSLRQRLREPSPDICGCQNSLFNLMPSHRLGVPIASLSVGQLSSDTFAGDAKLKSRKL